MKTPSSHQDDFAPRAFLGQLVRFAHFGQREALRDRNDELALRDGAAELRETLRVRMGPHRVNDETSLLGPCGLSDDAFFRARRLDGTSGETKLDVGRSETMKI